MRLYSPYGLLGDRAKHARYCTETDLFKKLPELDQDPEPNLNLVVKIPDPAKRSGSDRIRIRNSAAGLVRINPIGLVSISKDDCVTEH
jgi:hypothetical protein